MGDVGASTAPNALDFLRGVTLHSFPWRSMGQVLHSEARDAKALSGRARFTVRPGGSGASIAPSTSTVAEASGDVSATVRLNQFILNIAACNLSLHAGQDDPLTAFRAAHGRGAGKGGAGGNGDALAAAAAAAGLRLSLAAAVGPEAYAGVSYDLASRRPELSLAWTGETDTERASLSLHADPVDRSVRLRAAVAFPGPEWRDDAIDDRTGLVCFVPDDGGRHALWVEHEARSGNAWLHTRAGMRLDLGRAVNWLAAQVDERVRPRLPRALWRLPGAGALYNAIIPPEDEDQYRHRISGWDVDVACADASRPGRSTRLAVFRRLRLNPKRALALTEDSEEALCAAADARMARLAAARSGARAAADAEAAAEFSGGLLGLGGDAAAAAADEEEEEEELLLKGEDAAARAGLLVVEHRLARGRQRHGGEIPRTGAARRGGDPDAPPLSAAARRAALRRLADAGYSVSEDGEEAHERWGRDKRAYRPGVSAAVGAAYDLGTGAVGAELRLGSALRAVAGLGSLTRSGGFTAAPSLTLSIEPLALF